MKGSSARPSWEDVRVPGLVQLEQAEATPQAPFAGQGQRSAKNTTLTLDCRFGQHRRPGSLHSTPGNVSDLGELDTKKKTSQTNAGAGVIGASRLGRPGGRRATLGVPGRAEGVAGEGAGEGAEARDRRQ